MAKLVNLIPITSTKNESVNNSDLKKVKDILAQIEKLRVASNAGKITGDEFLDKFKPLQKQLKSIKMESMQESLDDMDATLPPQVERFLDRAVGAIKGYNLSKKKEQLIIAKIIDALNLDKSQLMQAIQKIKKNDILKK